MRFLLPISVRGKALVEEQEETRVGQCDETRAHRSAHDTDYFAVQVQWKSRESGS